MSQHVKLHEEIFKIMRLIDAKWDDIISRKDEYIQCGKYYIKKKLDAFDGRHEYWRVSIELNEHQYPMYNTTILSFYKRGVDDMAVESLFKSDALVLTSFSDIITIVEDTDSGRDTHTQYSIPYDRSCSAEERNFTIDITEERAGIRELLHRMVEFQEMKLTNVDLVIYTYEKFVDVFSGDVYNSLTSRPFFMGVKL